jgi:hypothetical protein
VRRIATTLRSNTLGGLSKARHNQVLRRARDKYRDLRCLLSRWTRRALALECSESRWLSMVQFVTAMSAQLDQSIGSPDPGPSGLVFDTASSDPALGFAVPPGTWDLQTVMVATGRRLLSPRLPLVVTAGHVSPSAPEVCL